ncbi:MAG: sigma-70 family RNA polymerase sigma factor [Spiroplasma sp.]|nr:sigma-70 family RNA polymerase sigma factor [Spiroplasma sp.]
MNDDELIYLFLVIKNDWAFNYLYQKYLKLIKILTKKVFYKFFSIPLELNDFDAITYLIFYQSIINFQEKRNKSFKNFFLNNLNWGLLKYFKKYTGKNHQVLNLACSYQDYLLDNNFNFQDQFKQIVWINQLDDLNLSVFEKNVLKLKYQGFSNQEIMAKLNLTYKQVDNAFQRVIFKLRTIVKC